MVFGWGRRRKQHKPEKEPQASPTEAQEDSEGAGDVEMAAVVVTDEQSPAAADETTPAAEESVRTGGASVAEPERPAPTAAGWTSLNSPLPSSADRDTLSLMSALLRLHGAEDTADVAEAASLLGHAYLDRTHPLLLLADGDGALHLQSAKSAATAALVTHLSSLLGIALEGKAQPSRQGPLASIWLDDTAGVHVLSLPDLWGAQAGVEACQRAQQVLDISQVAGFRLASRDEPLGIALFFSCGNPPEPAMVDAIGRHLAVALANLRRAEKARQYGTVDPIRWIPDHSEFTHQLARETDRARRYGHPVTAALLVLDNFDALRLQYGWTVANRLLRSVSAALTECLRESDFMGSYRHDGFGVILAETSREGASEAAGRLRAKAAAVRVLGGEGGPVPECLVATASYPEDGGHPSTLLVAAESRLLPKRRHSSASA